MELGKRQARPEGEPASHEVGGAELDRALDWFYEAGKVGPDLRNKLSVILMSAGMIADDHEADPNIGEDIVAIQESVKAAMEIIDRIGFVYDPKRCKKEQSNFEEFMGSLVYELDGEFSFVNTVGEVMLPYGFLKLLVEELVKNGKAATEGVDDGQVKVLMGKRMDGDDEKIFIEVIDNGPGISEEKREKVFFPEIGLYSKGTGLSMVYYTAKKLLGGKVFLRSKTGEGSYTRVTVEFPINAVDGQ